MTVLSAAGASAVLAIVGSTLVLRGGRPEQRLATRRGGADLESLALVGRARRAVVVRRRRRGEAATVGALVEAWASQLRAGRPVVPALTDAFDDVVAARDLLPRTAAALAVDGDVGSALRLDGASASGPTARRALVAAGACWSVARDNGGRLADALDRLGEGIRADEQHLAHVRAQLAGPRATARLLAALPVFALVLGASLGLSPLGVLLGEPYGRVALLAGLLLDAVGLWWTGRLAHGAERAA